MKYFYCLLNWYFTFNKFLLPGFVGFLSLAFFWLTYFSVFGRLVSISIPLSATRSRSPIAWLSGISVVNQKISCWHRFVIFLMTDTRWVLSVSLVMVIVCPSVCLWLICFLCDSSWWMFELVLIRKCHLHLYIGQVAIKQWNVFDSISEKNNFAGLILRK